MQRANKNILRNYIRQWRVGRINSIQIYTKFEDVLDKALEFVELKNEYPKFIKKYELDNYKAYENLLAEAQGLLDQGKGTKYFQGVGVFKMATQKIEHAIQIRSKIQKGIIAFKAMKEAKSKQDKLKKHIDSLWLKQMPTYTLLGHLINRAEILIKEKKYVQANTLLNTCIADIKNTTQNSDSEQFQASVQSELDSIVAKAKETEVYARLCKDPQVPISKIEAIIKDFLEEGKLVLAERLIKDMCLILRDRLSFLKILNSHKPTAKFKERDFHSSLKVGSWIGGSNFLLSKEIQTQIKTL